jgi:hypothetical protein
VFVKSWHCGWDSYWVPDSFLQELEKLDHTSYCERTDISQKFHEIRLNTVWLIHVSCFCFINIHSSLVFETFTVLISNGTSTDGIKRIANVTFNLHTTYWVFFGLFSDLGGFYCGWNLNWVFRGAPISPNINPIHELRPLLTVVLICRDGPKTETGNPPNGCPSFVTDMWMNECPPDRWNPHPSHSGTCLATVQRTYNYNISKSKRVTYEIFP